MTLDFETSIVFHCFPTGKPNIKLFHDDKDKMAFLTILANTCIENATSLLTFDVMNYNNMRSSDRYRDLKLLHLYTDKRHIRVCLNEGHKVKIFLSSLEKSSHDKKSNEIVGSIKDTGCTENIETCFRKFSSMFSTGEEKTKDVYLFIRKNYHAEYERFIKVMKGKTSMRNIAKFTGLRRIPKKSKGTE